ncbi:MAG: HAD-IB family hydrolase [Candidatus Pacebacteria bacterium]|nr:HAD-IB family hydrolase [Candidatus Paceibacterota bacterium]
MKDAQKKVAVFDVDGTIFRSSLLIKLVESMVREGLLPKSAEKYYEKAHKKWLDREGGYAEYIAAMVEAFYKHIKGVHYSDFIEISKGIVANEGNHTYRYTRDLIKRLKKEGYFLLAVSHSPKTILDQFCPRLGFDKTYGMMYEIGPEDRLTGEITDKHLILNKAYIVKRAVEKENLTLKDSIGVGDTEGDISFLELVDTPICFNPNSNLYRHAKLNNWDVVVERKDVIYEI